LKKLITAIVGRGGVAGGFRASVFEGDTCALNYQPGRIGDRSMNRGRLGPSRRTADQECKDNAVNQISFLHTHSAPMYEELSKPFGYVRKANPNFA
jgi:hypothetical protein